MVRPRKIGLPIGLRSYQCYILYEIIVAESPHDSSLMIHNLYANEAGYTVHIINTIVHLRFWPDQTRDAQDRPDSPD